MKRFTIICGCILLSACSTRPTYPPPNSGTPIIPAEVSPQYPTTQPVLNCDTVLNSPQAQRELLAKCHEKSLKEVKELSDQTDSQIEAMRKNVRQGETISTQPIVRPQ